MGKEMVAGQVPCPEERSAEEDWGPVVDARDVVCVRGSWGMLDRCLTV